MNQRELRILRDVAESLRLIRKHIYATGEYREATNSPEKPQSQAAVNVIISLPPAITSYCESEERERPQREHREKIKRRVEYVGASLLAVYTAFTIGMYFANRDAAEAAKRAASTAENTLRSSGDSFDATLVEMKAQSRASQKSAAAAQEAAGAARRSVDTSIANFRIENRPTVVLLTARLIQDPEVGQPIAVFYELINSGKTPATDTFVFSYGTIRNTSAEPTPSIDVQRRSPAHKNSEIVPPNGIAPIHSSTVPFFPSADQVRLYRSGAGSVYAFLRVDYSDNFSAKKDHWTKICIKFQYGHPLSEYNFCERGNDVDREEDE